MLLFKLKAPQVACFWPPELFECSTQHGAQKFSDSFDTIFANCVQYLKFRFFSSFQNFTKNRLKIASNWFSDGHTHGPSALDWPRAELFSTLFYFSSS